MGTFVQKTAVTSAGTTTVMNAANNGIINIILVNTGSANQLLSVGIGAAYDAAHVVEKDVVLAPSQKLSLMGRVVGATENVFVNLAVAGTVSCRVEGMTEPVTSVVGVGQVVTATAKTVYTEPTQFDATLNLELLNVGATDATQVQVWLTTTPSAPVAADLIESGVVLPAGGQLLLMGMPVLRGESVVVKQTGSSAVNARVEGFFRLN